jgi:hypothetical protein
MEKTDRYVKRVLAWRVMQCAADPEVARLCLCYPSWCAGLVVSTAAPLPRQYKLHKEIQIQWQG